MADRIQEIEARIRLLATTPGPENVTRTLRLLAATAADRRMLDRYAASWLASCHPVDALAVAFTGGGGAGGASEELRACLVHELVLRGVVVAELPGVARWATSPHWRHHPLGWLPLTLSGIEEDPPLPSYSPRGSSHPMPYGPAGPDLPVAVGARLPRPEEDTTRAWATAAAAAVANWVEESNGRVEARVFGLAEPLDTDAVPSALRSLGLECLDGIGKKTQFSVSPCPPAWAWQLLFAAASLGGAYNHGSYGAYGRLAAWRSLAGLSGAAVGADAGAVEAQIHDCTWYTFAADTAWFNCVAWDIGLVALAPDRRSLAVLAATDTD
jgi:hypothetical protein